MRIRFTQTLATVQATYKRGSVHEMEDKVAQTYIRAAVAVEVPEAEPAAPAADPLKDAAPEVMDADKGTPVETTPPKPKGKAAK